MDAIKNFSHILSIMKQITLQVYFKYKFTTFRKNYGWQVQKEETELLAGL